MELVGENRIALSSQSLHHTEIGHVTGGEQQRGGLAGKCRKLKFELLVYLGVATHQMCRTRTHAISCSTLLQRGDELRMIGQPQVIVAAKRQIGLAVHDNMRRLRALQRAALSQQTKCRALVQFIL